jgi:hypothetical protein
MNITTSFQHFSITSMQHAADTTRASTRQSLERFVQVMDVFAMNHHSSATTLQEIDVSLSATRTLTPFHREIAIYPFSIQTPSSHASRVVRRLCDELDDTTGLLDLLLGLGAEVAGADDNGDSGETALSENLGVAEGQEVEDGSLVGLLGEVLLALLSGDERPELVEVDDGLPELVLELVDCGRVRSGQTARRSALLLTVPHTNLSEVTGMVLVDVGPVVVLTTSHTATSGMLPVLSDTSVSGGDVTAVLAGVGQSAWWLAGRPEAGEQQYTPGRHIDGCSLVSWTRSLRVLQFCARRISRCALATGGRCSGHVMIRMSAALTTPTMQRDCTAALNRVYAI